jgi:hypothetical protein
MPSMEWRAKGRSKGRVTRAARGDKCGDMAGRDRPGSHYFNGLAEILGSSEVRRVLAHQGTSYNRQTPQFCADPGPFLLFDSGLSIRTCSKRYP